jgi:two-component system chemotaxis response regulator CheB
MPKIRVLVVDDAVVVRKIVTDALSHDPSIEVVGTASNGRIALSRIPQLNPDVVTLDIEMPELNGLETLKEIRKTYPRLPVIMFSTLQAQQRIRDDLLPKIHALCWRVGGISKPQEALSSGRKVGGTTTAAAAAPVGGAARAVKSVDALRPRIDIVAIGVSTGGPNALAQIFQRLPHDFPVPIVIVQHMPPMFTKLLAERLNSESALTVEEGIAGRVLSPGKAYIAPGNYHMTVRNHGGTIQLDTNQAPAENSCRPAVDVLFKSVAATFGASTLAVVLTGMGQDGLRGCEFVAEAGGEVVVQDQMSSVVWGMPGIVAEKGLANRVLPLDQLASDIVRRVRERRRPAAGTATAPATAPAKSLTREGSARGA